MTREVDMPSSTWIMIFGMILSDTIQVSLFICVEDQGRDMKHLHQFLCVIDTNGQGN